MAKTQRCLGGPFFLTLLTVAMLAVGCTSEPGVLIQAEQTGDETGTTAAASAETDLIDQLRGTAWAVKSIDSFTPFGPLSLSFHVLDNKLHLSLADTCGEAQVTFTAGGFTVGDVEGLGTLCSESFGSIFIQGESVAMKIDEALLIASNGHEVIAGHFESESQTGPVRSTDSPPASVSSVPLVLPSRERPAFTPSDDTRLSGEWTVVGLWRDGAEIDLTEFSGRPPGIRILGRRLGGNDGCNGHGGGLFYATADGTASLQSGVTTLIGCPESFAREAVDSATFNATRWGRTATGNLVLANNGALVEFELTEAAPTTPVVGLSAPLNAIWKSATLHDYESFYSDGAGIEITFSESRVLLEVHGCDTALEFVASYGDPSEGSISLERTGDPNPPCELTQNSELTLEAITRADYFVSGGGGVIFWEGPNPLASFGEE